MATGRKVSALSVSGSEEVYDFVCSLCSKEGKDVEAIEICMDCEQYMCRPCSAQHGRFKAMRAHNVVKKDQARNLSLSILAGSEAVDFECTVCKIDEKYTAASVYCSNCFKYLCTSCLSDHNRFGLIKEHDMKTVEEIRQEVGSNNIPDDVIAKTPKNCATFSCNTCSKEVEVAGQLWVCITCGFSNMCKKCCDRHRLSNVKHRTVPFKEFQIIYEQYGRSVMSGSGKFFGPVCSECSVKCEAKNPTTFCSDCNVFLCRGCKLKHNSHRMLSESKVRKMVSDVIEQMEKFDLDCTICFNLDRESSAVGYCEQCDVFICTRCAKVHSNYFGQEKHRIMGLREVRARKESFFEKTLRSTRDSNSKICDCCRKKGIYTGAMYRCLDCQRNLCMPCLDFHETAINKHNLMNLFNREGKEESAGKLKGTLQSVSSTTVEFFPKSVQREKLAIVAVDLGSSRSGYTSIAFGMINEMAEGSITKMHLLQDWYTDFMCTTTPKSCLLFDEDQKPRHFGEEAFREYKELERKGKADCWYFFHKYDTYLRDENLTDKTKLCSANGKAMSAGKLFDALIDHLIRHFFRMPQVLLQAEDTKLVFLVPEEPSATVLYMLKNAAVKAGLDKDDVSTVSKQTCMIRYSQMYDLPTKELDGQMPEDFREPGKQFLIVDLGFDQAEVSVHERLEDGRFRDIDIKNLGEWGLKKCITESLEIFPQIFRKDLYREFCDQDPGWFSDVKKEITFKILGASYESTEKVNVTLPGGLRCLYEERTKESMAEAVRNLPKQLNVKLIGDKLRFDKSLFETIVESCITNNITLVRTILTKHRFKRINTIIFFGILLENRRIKKAMVENFDGAVLISSEKGLTASLGAAVISEFLKLERTSEYTYGINICQDFKTEVHTDDHRLRTASGPDICHNIFKRYFMKGEKIYVGERRCGRHSTVFPCQRKMILYILQSKRREPKYANENGIKELDKIVLDLGQDGEGEVAVMMMYTETKLLVEAFDVQKDSEGKDMLNRIYSGRF